MKTPKTNDAGLKLFGWGIVAMIIGILAGLLLILFGIIKLVVWDVPLWLLDTRNRRDRRRVKKATRIENKERLKDLKKGGDKNEKN